MIYDDPNRRVLNVFCRGDTGAPLATNIVQLDRRGNALRRTDELGNVFTNLFDGLDRIKVATGPATESVLLNIDLVTWTTNISQQATVYLYDNAGKVLTSSNALGEKIVTTSEQKPATNSMANATYFKNGTEAASWGPRPCLIGRCALPYSFERSSTRATHIQCCPHQPWHPAPDHKQDPLTELEARLLSALDQ